MGLCPEKARPEDIICVIFGLPVPFVLRPLPNGRYQLVGECYLDGFTDGQAMPSVVEGRSKCYFWKRSPVFFSQIVICKQSG